MKGRGKPEYHQKYSFCGLATSHQLCRTLVLMEDIGSTCADCLRLCIRLLSSGTALKITKLHTQLHTSCVDPTASAGRGQILKCALPPEASPPYLYTVADAQKLFFKKCLSTANLSPDLYYLQQGASATAEAQLRTKRGKSR